MNKFHELIAMFLKEQANWRVEKAADYADDPRNQRCAEGLRELATYVRGLPEDDERIIELGSLGVRDDLFTLPVIDGPSASYAVSRFRFDDPTANLDQFLTTLVPLMRADAIEQAYLAGLLERPE